MIRAVIFDWGGVMSRVGRPDEISANLAAKLGRDSEYARTLLKSGLSQMKRGRISEAEFWELLEREHGSAITLQERDIWTRAKDMLADASMVELAAELKRAGIKTATLTNVFPHSYEAIRRQGGYDIFDVVVASSEEGYAKPDPEFYQLALDRLGISGPECLFIDDQQYCLDAAAPFGIQTLQATTPEVVIPEVRRRMGLTGKA